MGDLPRILARPDLPTVNLPRTNADAYGAQAFGAMVQAADAWGHVLKEKQLPVDAAAKSSEYNILMEDAKNEVSADPDINTWRQNLVQKQQEAQAKVLEGVTDPRVAAALKKHAAQTLGAHVNDMTERAKKSASAKQLADITIVGGELTAQAARTDNPALRASATNTYNAMITAASSPTMIGGKVVPPTINPKEAEKLRADFNENVEKGRAYWLSDTNPEALLEQLKQPGSYPSLQGRDRHAVQTAAETTIKERSTLAKEIKKEQIDRTNTNLLQRNVDGSLTVGQVMAMPESAIPFEDRRQWVDRLERQAKAKDKEEADPFEKSVGSIRATVLNGVLTKPHEWPKERILGLLGKGLSNTHALQLVNMQDELTKDKSATGALRKYDPLHRALDTLDGLRRNYMFTQEGQDATNVTDANASGPLRLKNDEEYQKVVDRVIAAAQNGQDPRAVMQAEMKPYFEQKTKLWYEKWAQWFTQPRTSAVVSAEAKQVEKLDALDAASARYKEALKNSNPDEAARQFLLQNNKVVTPDTLKRAKEYLKSKGGK